MEFSDISQETRESKSPGKAKQYENAAFFEAARETDKNEHMYDQLNVSTATSGREDVDTVPTSSPNRTNSLVYLNLVMLVFLYIAVIVLIVIIALPEKNQDGGWSSWSSWGTCSESCGGGIRSQTRTCTNPNPSLQGKSCDGTPIQISLCNRHACSDIDIVSDGWSSWSSWGTCSKSCGGGIRSQTRTCTNPKPSFQETQCEGYSVKDNICNEQICPQQQVALTAYGISGNSSLVFPNIVENYSNGYDNSTGKFTCNIPGIYIFSFQISKLWDAYTNLVQCFLCKDSVPTLGAIENPYVNGGSNNDYSGYSLSLSGAFHLNPNDTVSVGSCSGISAFYTDNMSSFTGVLVTPDK